MATYNVNRETGELIPVSGGTLYADTPVGTILSYGGTVAPAGWLICDGSALNRTTYAELFSIIGTQFGVGDGSTTFNIPDMREAVPKGAGLTGKNVGNHVSTNGLSVGQFQDDRIQEISGSLRPIVGNWNGSYTDKLIEDSTTPNAFARGSSIEATGAFQEIGGTFTGSRLYFSASRVARTGDTTEVKSVGVNYIIKAQRVAAPADFMASIHEAMNDSVVTEITGNGSTNCSYKAYKKNGIVTVYFIISGNVASGQNFMFGTLPEGYRPRMYTWAFIQEGSGSISVNDIASLVTISPSDGSLKAYTYKGISSATYTTIGNATFIV